MKKAFLIILKVIGILILIVLIVGFLGWRYVSSTFLNFEKNYKERVEINELTKNGFKFLDRNDNGELDIYEDGRQEIDARVNDLLSQMTIEEKIHLLKGSGMASAVGMGKAGEGIPGAVGTIVPTPRLGIPTVYLSDGPAGLRISPIRKDEDRTYYCTAFPIASMLASTWNTELVKEVGEAMGNEALEYGLDVILGPGANIHRHPLCGRNFEYYSEDPILTGFMGAAMVNGIESNGVGTSVKHFVANNQETNRNSNDVIISERAMREIYLKGFEIIVEKAQPWTIMSSYNLINGSYVAESRNLLTDVLRGDWNFEGLVMSDWFGGKDASSMVSAGNDLLEPGTKKQWKALKKAHKNGDLTIENIDTSVKRILRLVLKSKKFQNYEYGNNPDLKAHAEVTRRSAAEGVVLLKNEQVLPISKTSKVALLGVTSYDFIAGGTGSGDVNEAYTISLEEGLKNAGFNINERAKEIYLNHKKANEEEFIKPEGMSAMFSPYNPPEMSFTEEELNTIAGEVDVAIITIGRNAGEGGDRFIENDFLMKEQELLMIEKASEIFHALGKKVIIVMNIGGVIETQSWKEKPDAILLAWQGGQEGGNSVADVISGSVNPSGKLPMTFPNNLNDHASNENFPTEGGEFNYRQIFMSMMMGRDQEKTEEEKVRNIDYTIYEEGIYVGYRHFDKESLEVSYPFGYGMSYTDFEFTNMEVELENDMVDISVTIQNTGEVAGKEVVQIYTEKPNSTIDRAPLELKAFAKTLIIEPGSSEQLKISIPISELSYWDENKNGWNLEEGLYKIKCGSSSRDIKIEKEITI